MRQICSITIPSSNAKRQRSLRQVILHHCTSHFRTYGTNSKRTWSNRITHHALCDQVYCPYKGAYKHRAARNRAFVCFRYMTFVVDWADWLGWLRWMADSLVWCWYWYWYCLLPPNCQRVNQSASQLGNQPTSSPARLASKSARKIENPEKPENPEKSQKLE